jgi:hypothetical protein
MDMRDALIEMRPHVRNSVVRSIAILDFSKPKFLSLAGLDMRKTTVQCAAPIVFRLHRYGDVALFSDE